MISSHGMNKVALIFLPHHDDEFFAGAHLKAISSLVDCVYLLYLTYDQRLSIVRSAETQKYLRHIGVQNYKIIDIGRQLQIEDGTLFLNGLKVLNFLTRDFPYFNNPQVIVPAWEGGHHDHDFANFIASAYCRRQHINSRIFEYGLYSGENLFGPLFFVSSFKSNVSEAQTKESCSYLQGLRHIFYAFCYRSQWKTFMGLFPFILCNRILGRRVSISSAPLQREYMKPPHSGRLFYERRFGIKWTDVLEKIKELI